MTSGVRLAWMLLAGLVLAVPAMAQPAPAGAGLAVAPNRVFQRDAITGNPGGFSTGYNKGWGAVSIPLPAGPGALRVRLRDGTGLNRCAPDGGSLIQDWTTPPAADSAPLVLPAGPGFLCVDLARGAGAPATLSHPIAVGEVTAFSGQSLAVGFASGQYGGIGGLVVPAVNGVVMAPANNGLVQTPLSPWQAPASGGVYDSAFAAEYLRLVTHTTGVAAGLVGYAANGVPIAVFDPANGQQFPALSANLEAVGWKFSAFLWSQGQTDASNNMDAATYQAKLGAFFDGVRARQVAALGPGARNFFRLVQTVPGAQGVDDRLGAQYQIIRSAGQAYAAADSWAVYVPGLDEGPLADGTHPGPGGRLTQAREFYRAFMGKLGLLPVRPGPSLVSASRAPGSRILVLTLAQHGGTALQGLVDAGKTTAVPATPAQMAAQLQVFLDGAVTNPLPLDPAAPLQVVDATHIRLTLAALPPGGDAAQLNVWHRYGLDADGGTTAVGIYDNAVDTAVDRLSLPRQLQPRYTPLIVPAPVPAPASLRIATIGGQKAGDPVSVAAGGTIAVSGRYTGAAPAALLVAMDGDSPAAVPAARIAGGVFSLSMAAPASGAHSMVVHGPGAASVPVRFTTASAAALLPLAGAQLQLDASQSGTLWADPARTRAAVPGGPVQGVSDSTGNHLVQPDPVKAPVLVADSQNGLPGLTFERARGAHLASVSSAAAAALKAGSFTMMAVARPGSSLHNMPYPGVVYAGSGGNDYNSNRFQFTIADYATAQRFDVTGAQSAINDYTNHIGLLVKAVVRFDQGSGTIRLAVNAEQEVQAAGAVMASLLRGDGWSKLWIGTTYGSSFDGMIYEVVIWPGVLATDADVAALQHYMTAKWGN